MREGCFVSIGMCMHAHVCLLLYSFHSQHISAKGRMPIKAGIDQVGVEQREIKKYKVKILTYARKVQIIATFRPLVIRYV